MLRNLLNQTAIVLNQTVTGSDGFGNELKEYASAGEFACRVQPWRGQEFEVDRDTRRTWFKIILEETAAGVIRATSRVQLSTQSQMGMIPDDSRTGADSETATYEVYGDPQVFRGRTRIMQVECILRLIEG